MDQSIEVAFILVADIVGEASSIFAIKHHQLCEPGRFANRLSVTGNGLFRFCNGNILVTQRVRPEPAVQCFFVGLKNDLALHPTGCKLAFWHIPVFSSGATSSGAKAFWTLLYAAHADLVLNGHYHAYERFDLQSPSGTADSNGIREIIVGTGGVNHAGLGPKPPNTQVLNNTAFGVLELTLHPTSYDWKFMPVPGASFSDSGTTACHT